MTPSMSIPAATAAPTGGDAAAAPAGVRPDPAAVARAIAKRSFCTLATTSPSGRPHVAGVLYAVAGGDLYVSTMRASRKARNIAADPRVGVCIPVRRLPIGPPSSVQFQGVGEIVAPDDPRVRDLVDAGRLKAVTSHGELDLPGACFLRITPPRRVVTYGLGMSLVRLVRDPLNAGGSAEVELP
ncbi:MAG TPA: pyridoxamine 5'-phosphate oxidase family protein [Acidimicrobiales bacterium]